MLPEGGISRSLRCARARQAGAWCALACEAAHDAFARPARASSLLEATGTSIPRQSLRDDAMRRAARVRRTACPSSSSYIHTVIPDMRARSDL